MRRALLLGLLCTAMSAGAQLPTLLPGARVRVEAIGLQKIEGTLMAQTSDSLTVAASGAVRMTLPSAAVTRIKASEGKSHWAGAVKGAKIGGIIGAGSGLLLAASFSGSSEFEDSDYIAAIGVYAVSGALWGMAIGGGVGAEKWKTVYTTPLRAAVGRTANGVTTVGVSLRF